MNFTTPSFENETSHEIQKIIIDQRKCPTWKRSQDENANGKKKNDTLFPHYKSRSKTSILFRFDRWFLEISVVAIIGTFPSPGKRSRWRFSYPGSRSGVNNWHFHEKKTREKFHPLVHTRCFTSLRNLELATSKGRKAFSNYATRTENLCIFFFTFAHVPLKRNKRRKFKAFKCQGPFFD